MKGAVEPESGMLLNLTEMKKYLQLAVTDPLDHKNIDLDIEYFKDRPSTVENIAVYIWENLKFHMDQDGHSDLLYKVKLWETEKNIATYKGES